MTYLPSRYNKIIITIHWVVAFMVIISLFVGGRMLAEIDNTDPEKIEALQGHMVWGLIIGILSLIRIVVRNISAKPAPQKTGYKFLDFIGRFVHILLYIFVIGMVASGVGIAILANLPDIVFQGIGSLPSSFDNLLPRNAHGLIAVILMTLIALHMFFCIMGGLHQKIIYVR